MGKRFIWPDYKALDNTGAVEPSATLNFYTTGTSTPLAVYSDQSLSTVRTQPITADSNGQFGDIFLQDADYRVIYKDADGTTIWDQDPVESRSLSSLSDGSAASPSLNFQNATDTGLYLETSVTNDLGISTNGTLRGVFSENGKFLYGTATPITTANSVSAAIQLTGTTAPTSYMSINRFSNDTSSGALVFTKSRATSPGSFATTQTGDFIGQIIFGQDLGSDYLDLACRITGNSYYDSGVGALVGDISIYTGGNSKKYTFASNGDILPVETTNNQNLGANVAANAFTDIFSKNAVTIVSDQKYKANPQDMALALQKACLECVQNMKVYNRINPGLVDNQGNELTLEERTEEKLSIGVIAQEVIATFQKHGLDAYQYRLITETKDGELMVMYDHLHNGALSALANGVTLP